MGRRAQLVYNCRKKLAMLFGVAFFTFKGGVGKTTLTILLATILAKLGFVVVVFDADRQGDVTTHFQENPPKKPEELQETEEDFYEDEASRIHEEAQAQAKKQWSEFIEQQKEGRLCIPCIPGEVMPPDSLLAPITSDYLIPHRNEYDDIATALTDYIKGNDRDLKLKPVQTAHYNGLNDTGKLWLLQGSKALDKMEDTFKAEGVTKWRTLAAYREMQLHAAKQYGASFVFSDMGPSTDVINRVIGTSADIIQPCVCPDSFSWSNAMSLITHVLPDWMASWISHRQEEQKESGCKALYSFNDVFPKVMPFMAMQFYFDPRKHYIHEADANFIKAMQITFDELVALVTEGDATGSGSTMDNVSENQLDAWRAHLEDKKKQPEYMIMLKTIITQKFVVCKDSKMVIPLLRRFKHMTECHEFGVAMFDVTKEDVYNYHAADGEEVTAAKKRRINTVYANVKKEGKIMQEMLIPVAKAYMALLVAHNADGKKKHVAHTGAQSSKRSKGKTTNKRKQITPERART